MRRDEKLRSRRLGERRGEKRYLVVVARGRLHRDVGGSGAPPGSGAGKED
jgi:hypothetical protein